MTESGFEREQEEAAAGEADAPTESSDERATSAGEADAEHSSERPGER